jgi:hypothetical protein
MDGVGKHLPAADAEEALVAKDHIIIDAAIRKCLKSQVSRRRLPGLRYTVWEGRRRESTVDVADGRGAGHVGGI